MIPPQIFSTQGFRVLAVSAGIAAAALFTVPAYADHTGNNGGVGNGNQVEAPVQAPITIKCNAVGVLGNAKAECPSEEKPQPGKTKKPKPSPSDSPSPSPSQSTPPPVESPSTPVKTSNEKDLPVTGVATTSLLLGGAAVLGAGGAMLIAARRRAVQH